MVHDFDNTKLENLRKILLSDECINEIFYLQFGYYLDRFEKGFNVYSGIDETLMSVAELIDWLIDISSQFDEEEVVELHKHLLFVHSLKEHFRKFQLPSDIRLKILNEKAEKEGFRKVRESDFYDKR